MGFCEVHSGHHARDRQDSLYESQTAVWHPFFITVVCKVSSIVKTRERSRHCLLLTSILCDVRVRKVVGSPLKIDKVRATRVSASASSRSFLTSTSTLRRVLRWSASTSGRQSGRSRWFQRLQDQDDASVSRSRSSKDAILHSNLGDFRGLPNVVLMRLQATLSTKRYPQSVMQPGLGNCSDVSAWSRRHGGRRDTESARRHPSTGDTKGYQSCTHPRNWEHPRLFDRLLPHTCQYPGRRLGLSSTRAQVVVLRVAFVLSLRTVALAGNAHVVR